VVAFPRRLSAVEPVKLVANWTVRGETVAVAALCLATMVAGWIVADPQTVGIYHDDGSKAVPELILAAPVP